MNGDILSHLEIKKISSLVSVSDNGQWVCVKSGHCFVHCQAEQQCILCVHMLSLFTLSYLYICNAANHSFTVHMVVPFPVLLSQIYLQYQ